MLTEGARDALGRLDGGAVMNVIHPIARELIEAGLARSAWGTLEITEAGRILARKRSFSGGEGVADLSAVIINPSMHPMGPPLEPFVIAPDMPAQDPTPPALPSDAGMARALRAAGVASGVTGVWVEETWVRAFVTAWEASET